MEHPTDSTRATSKRSAAALRWAGPPTPTPRRCCSSYFNRRVENHVITYQTPPQMPLVDLDKYHVGMVKLIVLKLYKTYRISDKTIILIVVVKWENWEWVWISPNQNEKSSTLVRSLHFHSSLDWFLKGNSCGKNPIILHNQGHVAGDFFSAETVLKRLGTQPSRASLFWWWSSSSSEALMENWAQGRRRRVRSDIEMWATTTDTTSLSKQPQNWFLWEAT